jgi:microcystin-dependent protein
MTRKIFANGDILYAEDVNTIGNPIVDGDDLLGHGAKVVDEYLDDGSDQIKSRFYNFYNRLKVTHNTGLSFSYGGGIVLVAGTLVSISPGNITVANNATRFIYVDNTGDVVSGSTLPNECFPLAIVTTSGGTISGSIQDLRDKIIDRVVASSAPTSSSFLPGMGMEYHGTTLPSGWLWQDGSGYSTAAYPDLFAAIGYVHGGSGGIFFVPDRRGRTAIGSGTGASLTNRVLGTKLGTESEILNISQMPSHNHGVTDGGHNHGINESEHNHFLNDYGHNHGLYDPGHAHSLAPYRGYAEGNGGRGNGAELTAIPGGSNIIPNTQGNRTGIQLSAANSNIGLNPARTNISLNASPTYITINNQGGNGSHNNMQPSIVCNFIIKT